MHCNGLNPCNEGLEDNILPQDDDPKDGTEDINNGDNLFQNEMVDITPGCCRRYSCCYPLIIISLVWLMMVSAQAFEHCQDCISTNDIYKCKTESAEYYCIIDIYIYIYICCT